MAIVVPFAQAPAQRQLPPMPDPQYAMMAAAMMHENGRLVQPTADRIVGRDKGEVSGLGESEFGKDVLKRARRSNNIEDERDPEGEPIIEHNEKLPLMELKTKGIGPTS